MHDTVMVFIEGNGWRMNGAFLREVFPIFFKGWLTRRPDLVPWFRRGKRIGNGGASCAVRAVRSVSSGHGTQRGQIDLCSGNRPVLDLRACDSLVLDFLG